MIKSDLSSLEDKKKKNTKIRVSINDVVEQNKESN